MVKENISIKFLIHLVGERPALWDKTSEDYKDRKLKETSWLEICAFVNENFYSLPKRERDDFYKIIMKKWTHIRDSWVKSMKYGYDEVTKLPPKPYVYHNELKFMQKILKCRPHRFDLTQCQPSNTHFEEYFRDANETQTTQDAGDDDNDDDDEGDEEKQLESSINKTEPKTSAAEDSDEWQLEETELVRDEEEEEDEKNKKPELVKKKRSSIFISSRSNEDGHLEQKAPSRIVIQKVQTIAPPPSFKPAQAPSISPILGVNSFQERHWNFFKGILPSINGLDEDHILQFQSGVISLLQKLRECQRRIQQPQAQRLSSHSLFKGRGRKRKASLDGGDDGDDNFVASNNSFSRRKSVRKTFDPIAPENAYSSDD